MDPGPDVPLVLPPELLVVGVDLADIVRTTDEDAADLRVIDLVEHELARVAQVDEPEDRGQRGDEEDGGERPVQPGEERGHRASVPGHLSGTGRSDLPRSGKPSAVPPGTITRMGVSDDASGDAPAGGTLFVVGTPIGNLGDVTERAREVLASVDVVAAEDTRRTGRLLRALGIAKPRMISVHDANERARTDELLRRLRRGGAVALVSDGGMPLVSDPGFRVVRAAVADGIDVRVVPGPSAAVAALVVSGLPSDRWAFEGFLPKKPGERRRRLEAVAGDDRTLVFFESPLRLRGSLADVIAVMGDRQVAMCRELTKLHEDVVRGRASEVLTALGDTDPKGEVVLVVAGSGDTPIDLEAAVAEAADLVAAGTKKREAARAVAARHGLHANDLYEALLDDPSYGGPP